eukprot:1143373-Pelagomonas_calceolata.AAC.1
MAHGTNLQCFCAQGTVPSMPGIKTTERRRMQSLESHPEVCMCVRVYVCARADVYVLAGRYLCHYRQRFKSLQAEIQAGLQELQHPCT